MLRDNPVLKKMIATGEERVGKLATRLLANEKLMGALQGYSSSSCSMMGTPLKRGSCSTCACSSTARSTLPPMSTTALTGMRSANRFRVPVSVPATSTV